MDTVEKREIRHVRFTAPSRPYRNLASLVDSASIEFAALHSVIDGLSTQDGRFAIQISLDKTYAQKFLDSFNLNVAYEGTGLTFSPAENIEIEIRPLVEQESGTMVVDQEIANDAKQVRPRSQRAKRAIAKRLNVPSLTEAVRLANETHQRSLDPSNRRPAVIEAHSDTSWSIIIPRLDE